MSFNEAELPPERRTVDWSAMVWAGLTAALVSLAMYLFFVPAVVGAGNSAAILRYIASVVLGPDVLTPLGTMSAAVTGVAIITHLALALIMTTIIAFVLHRWGLLTGIIGGALFGLAFFAINFFTFSAIHPHMFAMAHWSVAVVHIAFGALAGGVYELLEDDPPVTRARGAG